MVFYTSIWACLLITLILTLHTLSVLLHGMLAKVFSYVNIALHILLVLLLLYIAAELSELVLIFMGSALFRVALAALAVRLPKGEQTSDREEADT